MKRYSITVNGTAYDVQVQELAAGAPAPAAVAAAPAPAAVAAPAPAAAPAAAPAPAPAAAAPASAAGSVKVESPMPGTILDIKVSAGQQVASGDVLAVLEAMKMENDIVAPSAGVVAGVHIGKGDSVDTGTLLISLS